MLQKLRLQERLYPRFIQLNDREIIKQWFDRGDEELVFDSENDAVKVDERRARNGYASEQHNKRVTIHMGFQMAKMIQLPTTLEELLRIGGKHKHQFLPFTYDISNQKSTYSREEVCGASSYKSDEWRECRNR